MKLIRVNDLKPGMIVADNVYESKGGAIPLISRGVVLSNDYINRLVSRGIMTLYIEMPENYKGAQGETLEIKTVNKDINFDGKLQINGDVPENIKIEANESIVIKGNVNKNCIISSKTGAVKIDGQVTGAAEELVRITSSQKVYLTSAAYADIKTNSDVKVSGDIYDALVNARGEIAIDGKALRAELYSQSKIIVGECGNDLEEPVTLIVRPFECRGLFNELLKIDSRVMELIKEKERLQNVIDLIRRLGKGIEQLPQEKKLEMASGVKRFKEIEGELSALQSRKLQIKAELEGHLGMKRVIVFGNVFPGTRITIENSRLEIVMQDQRRAFYMKDFKVASSLYSGSY